MDNPKYENFLSDKADKVGELVAVLENRKCFEEHSCDLGKKHAAYLKACKRGAKQMPLEPLSKFMSVLAHDKDDPDEPPRPKIDEVLAYYYFSLATIHDKMRDEGYIPIHNDTYAKQLAKSVWPIIENLCVDRQHIINAAFTYVKVDLAKKLTDTGPTKQAGRLVEVIDRIVRLAKAIPPHNVEVFNEEMETLGAEVNALAIECGLCDEDNPPYIPGMLCWGQSVSDARRLARASMSGFEKAFPEVQKLLTLKMRARLLVQRESEGEQPKKPAEAEQTLETSSKPEEFLSKIADEVDSMLCGKVDGKSVDSSLVKACFKKQMTIFTEKHKTYREAENSARQQACDDYERIQSDPRYRNRDVGPPESGLIWDDDFMLPANCAPCEGDMEVEGWRRPQEKLPPDPTIWPEYRDAVFALFGNLLPCYYATLAVIYDYKGIKRDFIVQLVDEFRLTMSMYIAKGLRSYDELTVNESLRRVETDLLEHSKKEPLTKKAGLIYEKLKSLQEHEAMTLPEIQNWLWDEHHIRLDEGEWGQRTKKELKPYGLENRPRVGFYIREKNS